MATLVFGSKRALSKLSWSDTVKSLVDKLLPAGFARNVGVLVGGTGVAQCISILVIPVLTRLYSPDDFAVLAIYVSITTLVLSVAALRLEIAIPIPKDENKAIDLLVLALLFVLCIGVITLFFMFCFSSGISRLVGKPDIEEYLWLVPLGVVFGGAYSAVQYWVSRNREFPLIARTRMTQSLSSAAVQSASGMLGVGALGLIVGQIISQSGGVFLLGRKSWPGIKDKIKSVRFERLKKTFSEFKKYPKYSTLEALCNSSSIQVPVIIISSLVVGPEVGYLMLAMKITAIPLTLLGSGTAQVYLSQAGGKLQSGSLGSFTVGVVGGLLKVGGPIILLVGGAAPFLFPLIFGEEWLRAGELVVWMVPWLIFQLMASPVSMALHVLGRQKTALIMQLGGLLLRVLTVICAGYLDKNISESFAVSGGVFYFVYLVVVFWAIKVPLSSIGAMILKAMKWNLPALAIAVALVYINQ